MIQRHFPVFGLLNKAIQRMLVLCVLVTLSAFVPTPLRAEPEIVLPDESSLQSHSRETELELAKLQLEQARYRTDILKWIVVAVGAVVSFAVIDYGKLRLERFRVIAENQRELLNAYLKATDSPEPDVWKRKLNLIINSSTDALTKEWAKCELKYIDNYAALETLYLETLKIASQLVEPNRIKEPDRIQARVRYNQLYWADLPYAGESTPVEEAMVLFRKQLIEAEGDPNAADKWHELNLRLIGLSEALRDSSPNNAVNRSSEFMAHSSSPPGYGQR